MTKVHIRHYTTTINMINGNIYSSRESLNNFSNKFTTKTYVFIKRCFNRNFIWRFCRKLLGIVIVVSDTRKKALFCSWPLIKSMIIQCTTNFRTIVIFFLIISNWTLMSYIEATFLTITETKLGLLQLSLLSKPRLEPVMKNDLCHLPNATLRGNLSVLKMISKIFIILVSLNNHFCFGI